MCVAECASDEVRVDGGCTLDLREWTAPVLLSTVNVPNQDENSPSISADGLELVYTSTRITERPAVYVATRVSVGSGFGLGVVALEKTGDSLQHPELSPDRLELFGFRSLGVLYRSTRSDPDAPWEQPADIFGGANNFSPSISGDGLTLYFRDGGEVISKIERTSIGAPFGPIEVVEVPTLATLNLQHIDISGDELQLLISDLDTQKFEGDIYIARREAVDEPFGIPERIDSISDAGVWNDAGFNADATEIYLNNASSANLDRDLYVSFLR